MRLSSKYETQLFGLIILFKIPIASLDMFFTEDIYHSTVITISNLILGSTLINCIWGGFAAGNYMI